MKDKLKKLSYGIALLLVLFVFSIYFWRIKQTYTVVEGEKDNGLGRVYGYKVENYVFGDGMRITIWEKVFLGQTEMQSVYDLSTLTVDKVVKSEWIKSDGAIYLKLHITYHDSIKSTNPTSIIYDFHRGEMFITSDLNLWRIWSEKLSVDDWMTESEFEQILAKLRQ